MDRKALSLQFANVRNGDKAAFAEIYHDMKTPVYTVIYRIVSRQEIAEDIMQEVFLKLYLSPPDSSVRNPRAWMFQMARNLALDTLRQKQHAQLSDEMPANDLPLEERFFQRHDIEAALMQLPCAEREIVTMHLTAELGFQEIADITKYSISSVYRRYRKGLRRLRDILNGGTS